MRFSFLGVLAFAMLAAVPAEAQTPQTPAVQPDPLFDVLYPPELIMQHRRAIGLTEAQRDEISGLIQNAQRRVVTLQWEMLDEMQQLTTTMSAARVDLDRALDQLGDVLGTEQDIKEAHLEMLVRVKNLLTPQQQAALEELREAP